MSYSKYDFECVIFSHGLVGFPHVSDLRRSNPGLQVTQVLSEEGRGVFPNCDRNIYDWTSSKRGSFNRRVLFLEYDTFVSEDLRIFFGHPLGDMEIARKHVLAEFPKGFPYREEANKLPPEIVDTALLVAPLGVVMLSVAALDHVASDRHASIFNTDMDSEVRLASVVAGGGLSVVENPKLTHVRCRKSQLPRTPHPGIMHPCKSYAHV